jgi:large subunit ribosomal protein L23
MSPAAAAKKKTAAPKSVAPVATTGPTAAKKERLMSVLIAPHVTEKTSLAMQNSNQYAFRVRRDADKPEIKSAVELMFDVKVAGVQVVNEPGKERRFGKTPGRTQNWKKAYVRLAAGQAIDYEAKPKA